MYLFLIIYLMCIYFAEPEKVTQLQEFSKSTTQLVLTWTAPISDVDDYVYTVTFPDVSSITRTVSVTTVTLTLTPGATYTIAVAARKNRVVGDEETITVTMGTCVILQDMWLFVWCLMPFIVSPPIFLPICNFGIPFMLSHLYTHDFIVGKYTFVE